MQYNFTDGVRQALAAARDEALALGHGYVGTEHILLGLTGEESAAELLRELGLGADEIRGSVLPSVRPGTSDKALGELPYTSGAKKVLQLAMTEARDLSDSFVGTEHLLLGLLREEKGIAAQVLTSAGATLEKVRSRVRDRRGKATGRGAAIRAGANASDGGDVWFLEVDPDADVPIYEQIIARIEEAVATGKLETGERLPPVRQLAEELGVAPGTVARAYSELEKRGVLETEGARGTRVAARSSSSEESEDQAGTLEALLRPVAVAAYHLGATADQLRKALDRAMKGIFGLLD